MLVIGIFCGLAAALGQAVTYLLSRRYLAAGWRPVQLWVFSQLWLSLFTLPLLPLLWRSPEAGWLRTALPLSTALIGYLTAQIFFYLTVRHVPASRVAPLMGIKILFVAILALSLGLDQVAPLQWVGIALALVAAVAVQRAAAPLDLAGIGGVVATTMAFAVSDLSITDLQIQIDSSKRFGSIMFSLALIYTLGALPALAVLGVIGWDRQAAVAALPYAVGWLVCMVVLFAAIGWAGVVLAIILQALRGPLSIILGSLVARAGHHHLEVPTDRAGLVRQLLAAALMVVATAIYVVGGH